MCNGVASELRTPDTSGASDITHRVGYYYSPRRTRPRRVTPPSRSTGAKGTTPDSGRRVSSNVGAPRTRPLFGGETVNRERKISCSEEDQRTKTLSVSKKDRRLRISPQVRRHESFPTPTPAPAPPRPVSGVPQRTRRGRHGPCALGRVGEGRRSFVQPLFLLPPLPLWVRHLLGTGSTPTTDRGDGWVYWRQWDPDSSSRRVRGGTVVRENKGRRERESGLSFCFDCNVG